MTNNRTLRTPEADELRQACLDAAARISEAIGHPVSSPVCVTDWTYLRGTWRLSYVWLIPGEGLKLEPGKTAVANWGFRVTLDGRHCELAAWTAMGRNTFEQTGYIETRRLNDMLSLAFGIEQYEPPVRF
jgi:hypothetical protein